MHFTCQVITQGSSGAPSPPWEARVSGSFQDKVIWITGGGTGIGRALAHEFVNQGGKVAVSGRRADKLAGVVSELEAAGGTALSVPCDVTQDDTLKSAVATITSTWGRLDVAVANAGYGASGTVEELSAEEWRRQLDVNVVGAAMTAKHSLPALREAGGRLALLGSVASMIVYPKGAPYCASKFAVRGLGLAIALELHGSGVSCTTIYPGFVESDIARVDNAGVYHAEWDDRRPAKLMWPADKAARVVVAAIHKRKREFTFTGHGKIGAWVGRHMPGLAHFAMTRGKAKG